MKPLVVKGWDGAEQQVSLAELLSQVSEFCGDFNTVEETSTKRSDLRREAHRDMRRPILTGSRDRLKKYAIETGQFRKSKIPSEPWLCADPAGAIRLYGQIAEVPDGGYRLADVENLHQLEQLAYMQDEQLITLGPGGTVHMLGDARGKQEKYPGAPDPNGPCGGGGGKSLMGKARELILAAWANITRGTPLAVVRRSSMLRGGGVGLTIRELCAEANVIKSHRRDLDEYRYLSAETCRRIVNGTKDKPGLIHTGELVRLEPATRHRGGRTWVTLPAVYELPPGAAPWPATAAPARKRRRKRKHTLRRAA